MFSLSVAAVTIPHTERRNDKYVSTMSSSDSVTPFDYDACDWKTLLTQTQSTTGDVRKKFHKPVTMSAYYQRGSGVRPRPRPPFPPTIIHSAIERVADPAVSIQDPSSSSSSPSEPGVKLVKEGFERSASLVAEKKQKKKKTSTTKATPHTTKSRRHRRSYFIEPLKK